MVAIDRHVRAAARRSPGVALDANGYLACADDWTPEIATCLARNDGLELTRQHWSVIRLLRAYWYEELVSPPLRILVRLASEALGSELGSARSLHGLFPEGPAKQACRYAGLPRPEGCL